MSAQEENPGMYQPNGHTGVGHFYDPAVRAVARTAAKLKTADHDLVEKARERPLASTAIALAAGYLLGRLFSRFG